MVRCDSDSVWLLGHQRNASRLKGDWASRCSICVRNITSHDCVLQTIACPNCVREAWARDIYSTIEVSRTVDINNHA